MSCGLAAMRSPMSILLWRIKELVAVKNQAIYGGLGVQAAGVYDRVDPVDDDEIFGLSGYIGGPTPIGTLVLGVGVAPDSWACLAIVGSTGGQGLDTGQWPIPMSCRAQESDVQAAHSCRCLETEQHADDRAVEGDVGLPAVLFDLGLHVAPAQHHRVVEIAAKSPTESPRARSSSTPCRPFRCLPRTFSIQRSLKGARTDHRP